VVAVPKEETKRKKYQGWLNSKEGTEHMRQKRTSRTRGLLIQGRRQERQKPMGKKRITITDKAKIYEGVSLTQFILVIKH